MKLDCQSAMAAGFVWMLLLLAAGPAGGAEIFVAPNGDDAGPGSAIRPFQTWEAARDAVRALKVRSGLPRGGVTIWLRGGLYPRLASFELTAADSGTGDAPIVYRAAARERVILTGGQPLPHWHPVTNDEVLTRLSPEARGQVMAADLPAFGITNFGAFHSRGFGRATTPAQLELFFGGEPMTVARWPNQGDWSRIAGFPEGSGQGDEHGGKIGALTNGFYYSGDRPRRWRDAEDVWVHGYWAWDWANSYERIATLEVERRHVKTVAPFGLYGFRPGQRFHFLNVLEELDQPGEYYVDRHSGQLYFWPPQPLAQGAPMVSLLESPLVRLRDVSHVTLRGITLQCTRGMAVSITGGASNRIAGCRLLLIGTEGIAIAGGQGHQVTGCDIENTGDGGVSLAGGDRQTLVPAGHQVDNCHFQKQGRWSKCYVPAILANGVGHVLTHNLIHDHPHCAILFNGNEHTIEFNEIHHIALETGDVGAIYTGRDWTYRGNRIRHNFIHHTGGVGMGSMGVYMDDCVSGTEIYGNIFYRVPRAAFLGGGRDHRVENNIFVDCQPAVQLDARGLDPSPVWHDMVYDTMKKQLAAVPAALYRRRYPALAALDPYYESSRGIPPEGNVVTHNISVGGTWLQTGWRAGESMLLLRDNYVGSDPGFVAPAKMDFRLRKDSPAWTIGFQEIPVGEIGLQEDEFRRQGRCEAAP